VNEQPPTSVTRDELDAQVAELERAAARLRTEEMEPEEAAELVERCAELAASVGSALDREADAQAGGADPGQERLL
jgi:hypothetical protein